MFNVSLPVCPLLVLLLLLLVPRFYRPIVWGRVPGKVLLELKEYAQEVDVEFVRKAVRAIGRCAIKLERAAERCINVLLELIQTKVNYVLQEAVIVIKVRTLPGETGGWGWSAWPS